MILGNKRRITDLGRVKVQLEPFLSLCGLLDLEAPLIILAIVNDLATHCELKDVDIQDRRVFNTYVGTLSLETPSRLSELASGH